MQFDAIGPSSIEDGSVPADVDHETINIDIAPDSIAFVVEVEDRCGIPTLEDPQHDEIFGPYCVGRQVGFLSYTARTGVWRKETLRGIEPNPFILAPDPAWSEQEREQIGDALTIGGALQPPALPEDAAHEAQKEPFLYMGWLFAWYYSPVLRRWELAPLGRR